MRENFTRESFKEIFISFIFCIIIFYIGAFIFPFAGLVLALPFTVLGVKRGYMHMGLALIPSLIIIYLMSSILDVLSLAMICAFVALPLVFFIRRDYKDFKAILITSAIAFIGIILVNFTASYLFNVDLLVILKTTINTNIDEQIKIFEDLKSSLPSDLNMVDLEIYMRRSKDLVIAVLPAVIFILSYTITIISYYLTMRMLLRINCSNVYNYSFKNYRMPRETLAGFSIFALGGIILNLVKFQYSDELSLNLFLVAYVLLISQGLALLDYYLLKKRSIFKLILIIISLLFEFRIVYALVGLADLLFDIRRMKGRGSNE